MRAVARSFREPLDCKMERAQRAAVTPHARAHAPPHVFPVCLRVRVRVCSPPLAIYDAIAIHSTARARPPTRRPPVQRRESAATTFWTAAIMLPARTVWLLRASASRSATALRQVLCGRGIIEMSDDWTAACARQLSTN